MRSRRTGEVKPQLPYRAINSAEPERSGDIGARESAGTYNAPKRYKEREVAEMPKKASGEFNQNQYINDFMKKNYDRINLTVPAGKKAIIAERAASKGKSTNAYINDLIDKDLEKTEE